MSYMAPRKKMTRRETDEKKIKPNGVLLNGQGLRSEQLEALLEKYVDAASIYLRENDLDNFHPYGDMPKLAILDVSMNNIDAVDFLGKTPALRHLFMTSNQISSLSALSIKEYPSLKILETLCLSDNGITSFEGLGPLPSLRLLSLSYNQIESFKSFPELPQLHTIHLIGNLIENNATYRSMVLVLTSPNLVCIDQSPVQQEEREAVEHYRGKVAFCLGEGMILEGDNAEEAADKFLHDYQRAQSCAPPPGSPPNATGTWPLIYESLHLASEETGSNLLTEGVPVKLNVCLRDARPYEIRQSKKYFSNHIFPVTFRASGDATEACVVGSMNQWTDPIPMERCEVDGEVFYHVTLYLSAGDYEYRYILDGQERVSEEHKVLSKYKQGECNLYHVTEPETQDCDGDSMLCVRWLRSDGNRGFTPLPVEDLVYTPTGEDIGCCLRAEVFLYESRDDDKEDAPEYTGMGFFDISTPVSAGLPMCTALEIIGDAAEGERLTVNAIYAGGVEGESGLAWFRVGKDGEEMPIDLEDPWAGYELGLDDIGHRIKVEFTPVRKDYHAGAPRSEMTAVVAAGVPSCREIRVIGEPTESETLTVETTYTGGVEGESLYQWYRHDDETDEYFPIPGETCASYVPELADVGKILAVEYTPISREGIEGDVARCILSGPIEPAAPCVRHISINGELEEQHVLVVELEYFGGHFGTHQIQWFRKEPSGRSVKIGTANTPTYTLTAKEVDCVVEVVLTPVRADGVQGERCTVCTEEPIRAALPQLRSMDIVGDAAPGNTLEVAADYFGGEQGESIITWSRATPDSRDFEIVAKKTRKYVVTQEDVGRMLKICYTPVRKDGVQGEMKYRHVEVPGKSNNNNNATAASTEGAAASYVDPVPQE